jgi:membrane associated rhomboid family serine protease
MQREGFWQYVKRSIVQAGLLGKLVTVNTIVFLVITLLLLGANLSVNSEIGNFLEVVFTAPPTWAGLAKQPWSAITYMFAHTDVIHFLVNMLMLFFCGRLFVHFLGDRKLLLTYLLGGIFGYLFQTVIFSVFPYFQTIELKATIGASGSVMALLVAVSLNQPRYRVNFFGLFPVSLLLIAAIYVLMDISLARQQGDTAHFVHLGGALFGGLSVIRVSSPGNFMNRLETWLWGIRWPKLSFKRKPKFTVHEGAKNMDDHDYNYNKKKHQERIDAILDKISKKGYDGLTKEEKQILFDESKRK